MTGAHRYKLKTTEKEQRDTDKNNNTSKRTKCLLKFQQQQQCDFLTTHKNVALQAFNMYTTTKRLSWK